MELLVRQKRTAAPQNGVPGEASIMYKVGSPFWKMLTRLDVPTSLRIDVRHDDEANVFDATSPDLKGYESVIAVFKQHGFLYVRQKESHQM